jgi:hypothetical protein
MRKPYATMFQYTHGVAVIGLLYDLRNVLGKQAGVLEL